MNPTSFIGRRFHKLTVLKFVERTKGHDIYECVCKCGTVKTTRLSSLLTGNTKSCGCLAKPHGHLSDCKVSPEHRTYQNMMTRCYNPNSDRYKDYGARGITVCKRRHTFKNFLADMGLKPFLRAQIDRKDNDKNYTKSNCHWTTAKENSSNRRNTQYVTYKGEKKTVAQWAEHLGIPNNVLHGRICRYGWPIVQAFTTPVVPRKRR